MDSRILILADDLSGAADCAVACVRAGLEARVCLDGAMAQSPIEALAVDLDTRQRTAAQARAATLAARDLLGGRTLYRKFDSTLRGHVGVELAATLEIAGPGAFAVVCPAYPAMGRAVLDGQVFVDGAPLRDTEIWRREGHGEADLAAMLAAAGLAVARMPLDVVRQGAAALGARMAQAVAGGARALVCDAQTEEDMSAIVAAGLPLVGALWAGSGGLAIPLAAALSPRAPAARPAPRRGAGPLLVVVGSASSVSRRQLEALSGDPGVAPVRISPKVLLDGPGSSGWRPASRSLVAAIGRPGKDVVVAAIDPEAPVDPAHGPRLTAALGQLIGPQLSRFGALAATGGETARGILEAVGAHSLRLEREIEPGIPLSIVEGSGLPVVTKAGAFGGPLSLARCVQALRALPLALTGVSGASLPVSGKESLQG
jgi:uncharacterized protein YgbK (DUF1537 family)